MTAKEQKFLNLVFTAAKHSLPADAASYYKTVDALISFDYSSAVLVWEYFMTEEDGRMAENPALAAVLTDGTESIFEKKAGSRFVKLLTDSHTVRDGIYRRSPTALKRAETIGYAAQLMLSGKTEESDDILKSAMKNASGDFGPFMAAVVDRLIIELTRKNPNKPSFPKKLAAQVLSFSEKIKGPEKAFIAQRIREL